MSPTTVVYEIQRNPQKLKKAKNRIKKEHGKKQKKKNNNMKNLNRDLQPIKGSYNL